MIADQVLTIAIRERIALDAALAFRCFGPHADNPYEAGTEEHKVWAAAIGYAIRAETLEGATL